MLLPKQGKDYKEKLQGKTDILIITETKLYSNFSYKQFVICGYAKPYRLDWNLSGGDVIY